MVKYKCAKKLKDKSGKIYAYHLVDASGNYRVMTSDFLKRSMSDGAIEVINLTLTSDYKLIDSKRRISLFRR